jgi:hypothetical protein
MEDRGTEVNAEAVRLRNTSKQRKISRRNDGSGASGRCANGAKSGAEWNSLGAQEMFEVGRHYFLVE